MTTHMFTDTLTVIGCYKCGVAFGIPASFDQERRQDHQDFYCPNGHPQGYHGPSQIERERDAARKEAAACRELYQQERACAERAQRRAAASRGVVTKLKRRIAKGVCPCCRRQFADLHRHMSGQHPEFLAEEAKP